MRSAIGGLVLFPWLLAAQAVSGSNATFEVSGEVLDADSREPVAMATVTIVDVAAAIAGRAEPLATSTDSAGAFRFSHLPGGGYNVDCDRSGYVHAFRAMQRSLQSVSPGGKAGNVHVTLYLRREVIIEGTILDTDGQRIAGGIRAFRLEPDQGRLVPVEDRGTIEIGPGIDKTGRFRLAGLQPGRYFLAFVPNRFRGMDYPLTVYPDSPDAAGGQTLEMPPGTERHVDFRIQRIPTYTVSGKVPTTDNRSVLSICSLASSGLPIREDWGGVSNTRDLSFRHTHIPAGDYVVEAQWNEGTKTVYAAKRVTVTGQDVEGIVLEPSPPRSLRATFKNDSSTDAGNAVRYHPVDLVGPDRTVQMESKPDGTLFVEHLSAGRYQVRVDPQRPSSVESIRQGGHDVLSEGILAADSALEPLEIVVRTGSATVLGSVEVPGANLDEGIMVAFFREAGGSLVLQGGAAAPAPLRFRQRSERFPAALNPMAAADDLKEFRVEGLPAGDYLVFAWLDDSGAPNELPYNTPEFLKRFGWAAERIKIGESETQRVTVRNLLPWNAFGLF